MLKSIISIFAIIFSVSLAISSTVAVNAGNMISEDQASKIVLEVAESGIVESCEIKYDNNLIAYHVSVRDGNYYYEFKIDAVSGKIISFTKEEISLNLLVKQLSISDFISSESAKAIAEDITGGGLAVSCKLSYYQGNANYRVVVYALGNVYVITIDAYSGYVKSFEYASEAEKSFVLSTLGKNGKSNNAMQNYQEFVPNNTSNFINAGFINKPAPESVVNNIKTNNKTEENNPTDNANNKLSEWQVINIILSYDDFFESNTIEFDELILINDNGVLFYYVIVSDGNNNCKFVINAVSGEITNFIKEEPIINISDTAIALSAVSVNNIQTAQKAADKPTGPAADKAADKPAGPTADKAADKPAGQAADKAAGPAADKAADKPAGPGKK